MKIISDVFILRSLSYGVMYSMRTRHIIPNNQSSVERKAHHIFFPLLSMFQQRKEKEKKSATTTQFDFLLWHTFSLKLLLLFLLSSVSNSLLLSLARSFTSMRGRRKLGGRERERRGRTFETPFSLWKKKSLLLGRLWLQMTSPIFCRVENEPTPWSKQCWKREAQTL